MKYKINIIIKKKKFFFSFCIQVAYFTGTFPFAVLIILFFRGVTLDGAGKGIKFYLKPDFEMMKHAKVNK